MAWPWFAALMLALTAGGLVLWRRWRRWNPTRGTSEEARQAEARLWSTRGPQR